MSGIKRIRNLLSGGAEDRSFRCRSRQTNEDCIVEVSSPTGPYEGHIARCHVDSSS